MLQADYHTSTSGWLVSMFYGYRFVDGILNAFFERRCVYESPIKNETASILGMTWRLFILVDRDRVAILHYNDVTMDSIAS